MTLLILAEHDNASLNPATRHAVGAARKIASHTGGEIHLLVAGAGCRGVVAEARQVDGVAKVRVADYTACEHHLAEDVAPLLADAAQEGGVTHVLAAATSFGKDVMPRAAALMDVAQVSDLTGVLSADTFTRPIYAGNAIATVQATDAVKALTVRTVAFDAVGDGDAEAAVEEVGSRGKFTGAEFVKMDASGGDRPELTAARVVVSGGRGVGSAENFAIIESLADTLGAAVGASRAAVDAGYVPNDYQVGQTGKVVAPELYIAVGISGAIQHIAGMKDSKVIVAINTDENAPIFDIADYGLVADLFEAVPALQKALAG